MSRRDERDAQAALAEVERVQRRTRAAARRAAWIWLAIGVATSVFLLGTPPGRGSDLGLGLALAYMGLGLALWFFESRQPVVGRAAAMIDRPMTWAFVAAVVVASLLKMTVLPDGYSAGLVAASLLPAAPALLAAWRLFRA